MYRSPRRATPSKSRTSHSKGKTTPQRQTPTLRKVTENPTPKKSPPQNPGSTYVFTSPNPVQKEERDLRRVRRDLAREKQLYMMELSRLERNHTPKRRKLFEDHADDAHELIAELNDASARRGLQRMGTELHNTQDALPHYHGQDESDDDYDGGIEIGFNSTHNLDEAFDNRIGGERRNAELNGDGDLDFSAEDDVPSRSKNTKKRGRPSAAAGHKQPPNEESYVGFNQTTDHHYPAHLDLEGGIPQGSVFVLELESQKMKHLILPNATEAKSVAIGHPFGKNLVILDTNGQVYIFMASQWDSAPQRIVALVNRHVTSIQVHGASCLSATTKDGFALLLQPSGDATSHLADQYQVTETIVVNGEKIVAVQVVEGCVAVLTDKGQVFTRGTNALVLGHPPSENFRPPIGLESVFVASISFSDEHALALDKASSVYSWGIPVEGRLGLGETVLDMPVVASPRKISHLKNIIKISAGRFVSAFLDKLGRVFTCGSGKYLSLGHGSNIDELLPREIVHIEGKAPAELILDVSITNFQMTCMSSHGKVYVCGMDAYTEAPGRDNQKWNATLHAVRQASFLHVDVSCGSSVMGFVTGKPPVIVI